VASFTHYLFAPALVALVLAGLAFAARRLERLRGNLNGSARTIVVLESRMLSQHASLHVVRIGERRLLIGVTAAAVSLLSVIDDG
jgi:flagellar biogenesis protein FliO